MSEFRAGFFQHLHKLFGDMDAITYLKNMNANMWLRQRNFSPPLTYFHRSLYVHMKVSCDNFANAATSLPQHFLIIIKSRKQILNPTAACKKWNKSSITIAASSVCKHEIFTDRLNKIQLRIVWCSINSYFCSKQTTNVFFHCTFSYVRMNMCWLFL